MIVIYDSDIYVWLYVCIYVCIYVWLYVWLYVCIYVWLYVWLYVCSNWFTFVDIRLSSVLMYSGVAWLVCLIYDNVFICYCDDGSSEWVYMYVLSELVS